MRDGSHSIDVYMACLTGCHEALVKKRGENLLNTHDHVVFHCTSTYLCRRAFDHFCQLSQPDISLKDRLSLYNTMTEPTTRLTKQIGSTYSASCYVNLYSLFVSLGNTLVNKRVLVFSYGSGAASSLYSLKVNALPKMDRNISVRLSARRFHDPDSFLHLTEAYSSGYAHFDFNPQPWNVDWDDIFVLSNVDCHGVRSYAHRCDGHLNLLKPDMVIPGADTENLNSVS